MPDQTANTSARLVGFDRRLVDRAITDPDQLPDLERRLAKARRAVVIVGSSVAGLVLAARLGAQARTDGGLEVALVVGSPPVPRRLVDGCSMRWSTVRRMSAAMSVSEATLIQRLGGDAAIYDKALLEPVTRGSGQLAGDRAKGGTPKSPFAGMSTRHGAILMALRESLDPTLPISLVDCVVPKDEPMSGNDVPLRFDTGDAVLRLPADKGVVLMAASPANLLRPGRTLPDPERWVVAVQAALETVGDGPHCGHRAAWVPAAAGEPVPNLGFFTPFQDTQIPDATWYGINTMAVSHRQYEQYGADKLKETVSDCLLELESQLGTREVEPKDTRAAAVVPIVRQSGSETERALDNGTPVVEVHRSFTSGAPAINVDGMLAAAIGADAFATAFLSTPGEPAAAARNSLRASDRALRGLRLRNAITETTFFRGPARPEIMRFLPSPLFRLFVDDFSRLGAKKTPAV